LNGRFCGALSFDGVNDRVNVADSNLLDLTNGMTLMAWVRPSSIQGWTTVVLKERPNGLAYALYASDDTGKPPAGYVNLGGGDESVTEPPALALNRWVHLATTFDGSNLRLYVNGALMRTRSTAGSIVTSGRALRIGGNEIWGEYFRGLIDEVRVYGRALSQAELEADLNRPASDTCKAATDTTPPTVSMTGPVAEGSITGRVTMSASAADNVALREVQFYVDGAPVGSPDRAAPYSFSWNTATVPTGGHDLTAVAIDAAGNRTTSAKLRVAVKR
jgi:hypothetical protein